MVVRKLVLLLGGTFDPVHNGHVRIAHCAQEATRGSTVYFVPCYLPPHRPPATATAEHRMQMLRIALADTPFKIDDCELRRKGISWTQDTVHKIHARIETDCSLCLLLGADAYANFHNWRGWKEIMRKAHLIVCAREGASSDLDNRQIDATLVSDCDALREHDGGLVWHLATPHYPEASTVIRDGITNGRAPANWLHKDVEQYIHTRGLYQVALT